jgi:UDP-N-acetyl-D-mannosaminuronate dehydrogenase
MIRVIGGMDPQGTQKAAEFYSKIVKAPIRTTDALAGELVRTMENALLLT